jgi:hypothetical protein
MRFFILSLLASLNEVPPLCPIVETHFDCSRLRCPPDRVTCLSDTKEWCQCEPGWLWTNHSANSTNNEICAYKQRDVFLLFLVYLCNLAMQLILWSAPIILVAATAPFFLPQPLPDLLHFRQEWFRSGFFLLTLSILKDIFLHGVVDPHGCPGTFITSRIK